MFSLIYVSSATRLFTEEELLDLLATSRANNEQRGITGMMLYSDGNFIQALEGDKETVLEIYAKIERDPRHRNLLIMTKREVPERTFPEWSMGFRNAAKLRGVPGVTTFLQEPTTPEALAAKPERARIILESFKDNVR